MNFIRTFKQWNQGRKDRDTLSRFQAHPSTFLREHTVNSYWMETPHNPEASAIHTQFHLVEQAEDQVVRRPGRVLGNWRTHRVKHYLLTDDPDLIGGVGKRRVGAFPGSKLPVVQTDDDTTPNLGLHPNSGLDVNQVPLGGTVHTMDLSGCTLKRAGHVLHHMQPHASADQLHANLPSQLHNPSFGPQDYGQTQTFVMMRKKATGLKLYSQQVSPAGIPIMTRRRFQ